MVQDVLHPLLYIELCHFQVWPRGLSESLPGRLRPLSLLQKSLAQSTESQCLICRVWHAAFSR